MSPNQSIELCLRMGDNALILGQRLAEWCGHGPILEQDIALTNISLDLIGQSRLWLSLAGQIEGQGRDEDKLAFFRDSNEFRHVNLCEQPNGHWGTTLMRQFLFDAFHLPLLEQLCKVEDQHVASIAQKSVKEVRYHLRWSSEWVVRLGAGTDESHEKMEQALLDVWPFAGEAIQPNAFDLELTETCPPYNVQAVNKAWWSSVNEVFNQANLDVPEANWAPQKGREGIHTERLGFILAEMQFLPRAYPDAQW
jgi:ring-1,2-phenylacetyl-CoA epoxidase subunit PaaC